MFCRDATESLMQQVLSKRRGRHSKCPSWLMPSTASSSDLLVATQPGDNHILINFFMVALTPAATSSMAAASSKKRHDCELRRFPGLRYGAEVPIGLSEPQSRSTIEQCRTLFLSLSAWEERLRPAATTPAADIHSALCTFGRNATWSRGVSARA